MALLTVVDDEEAVAATSAERVAALIEQSTAARGNAVVCLTGGRTPRRLYELLAANRQSSQPGGPLAPHRARRGGDPAGRPASRTQRVRAAVDWTRVHLFWGDERHVPPDHPESNFGMAHRALIAHVPIPRTQVHRIRGELPDAAAAAREYEATLREGFLLAGRSDQTFDVMLLGLGEDGHIASIFPGSSLLDAGAGSPSDVGAGSPLDVGAGFSRPRSDRRVAAVFAAHLNAWRITLTPLALLDARAILMVVSGQTKAEAVRAALELPDDVSRWPVHLLRAAGDRVEWIIDRAAATMT